MRLHRLLAGCPGVTEVRARGPGRWRVDARRAGRAMSEEGDGWPRHGRRLGLGDGLLHPLVRHCRHPLRRQLCSPPAISVCLAMPMIRRAVRDAAAALVATDGAAPDRLAVGDRPGVTRHGVHVLVQVGKQAVLAEPPAALGVLAGQHGARTDFDVLAEVAVLVVVGRDVSSSCHLLVLAGWRLHRCVTAFPSVLCGKRSS
mmetsp:Transcript_31042/g.99593  ORF Transcript_31042/g.99593 Transcript_31042/m.99593 type:complete len:201 (+) Transcript_31042:654-1256(+)